MRRNGNDVVPSNAIQCRRCLVFFYILVLRHGTLKTHGLHARIDMPPHVHCIDLPQELVSTLGS